MKTTDLMKPGLSMKKTICDQPLPNTISGRNIILLKICCFAVMNVIYLQNGKWCKGQWQIYKGLVLSKELDEEEKDIEE